MEIALKIKKYHWNLQLPSYIRSKQVVKLNTYSTKLSYTRKSSVLKLANKFS